MKSYLDELKSKRIDLILDIHEANAEIFSILELRQLDSEIKKT